MSEELKYNVVATVDNTVLYNWNLQRVGHDWATELNWTEEGRT